MTDTSNNWDFATGDGANQFFVIKNSEVIRTTAATQDGDDLRLMRNGGRMGMRSHLWLIRDVRFVKITDGADNLVGGRKTLYTSMSHCHLETTPAFIKDFNKISVAGGLGRGDYADILEIIREGALAGGIKQPLFGEFFLKQVEAFLNGAGADGENLLNSEGEFAPFTDPWMPTHDDFHAVFEGETELVNG